MMIPEPVTTRTYFKSLSILQLALVAGILLFGIIVGSMILLKMTKGVDPGLVKVLEFIVPLLVTGGIIASTIAFSRRLVQIRNINSLKEKMNDYRGALLIKYALLEVPALFAIIASFLSGKILFLAYAAVIVGLMCAWRPGIQHAINDLELDDVDRAVIGDPDGVIG